jgi:quinohemoprotein ethanol dehydrogenase
VKARFTASRAPLAGALMVALACLGWGMAPFKTSAGERAEASYLDNAKGTDWPGPGRTYGEQHFSPLAQIDQANVAGLGLAWSFDLPLGYSVTQPIAVGGKLFLTSGQGLLRALDARSGRELWTFDPQVWKSDALGLRMAWGSRGVSWWNGTIFMGTLDGRLIAVDSATGAQKWAVQTTTPGDGRYITGAPRVFEGKVIIGHGGADAAPIRGYVTAYDAVSGKQLWRFHLVPGDPAAGFENEAMAMAAKTWHGEWWKHGGGGTAWNAMSLDPETRTVFIGTGNGSPWSHKVRSEGKGDNLFLSSIVALDADTGRYKWHYQTNPGESWDYNAAMDIQLADLVIEGKPRKVLITAPKNGFLYVIDRIGGQLISARPYVPVTWTSGIDPATGRPVDVPNNRFENGRFLMAPGPVGAHSWLPMAYSPRTSLVYIPAIEVGAYMFDGFEAAKVWYRPAFYGVNGAVGVDMVPGDRDSSASLVAWDPVSQRQAWRIPVPTNVSGGVLATGGDLVFQGGMDGRFNAYDARTGKLLWSFDARAPVIAPPISYSAGGRQYVTVISGSGGSLSLIGDAFRNHPTGYREQARRVLTFAVGGKRSLPPAASYTFQPVADQDYVPRTDAEQRGAAVFGQTCIMCHGRDANAAGGNAPDLRGSPIILSAEAFATVVRQGALRQAGMPKFDDLTPGMVEDVRQYLRKRAAEARTAGMK